MIPLAAVITLLVLRQMWAVTGARRVRAALAERHARGESVHLASLVPAPIPDGDNAAVLLQDAFDQGVPVWGALLLEPAPGAVGVDPLSPGAREAWNAFVTRAPDEQPDAELLRKRAAEFRAILDAFAPILATAEVALQRPDSRFPIDYAAGFAAELPHLADLRGLARLLRLRAEVAAMEGDTDRALRDCATILRLGDTLADEPLLISYLVRVAAVGIAHDATEEVLAIAPASPAALRALADAFASREAALDAHFRRAVRGEVAMEFAVLQWFAPVRLPGEGGDVFYSIPAVEETAAKDLDTVLQAVTWAIRAAGPGLVHINQLRLLAEADALLEALGQPYSEAAPRLDARRAALDLGSGGMLYLFPSLMWTPIMSAYDAHIRAIATVRTASAGCQLLATAGSGSGGPATLARVSAAVRTDPFTDADLRLARTDQATILYALGMNGTDNGGTGEKLANRARDPSVKDDIAFRMPAGL